MKKIIVFGVVMFFGLTSAFALSSSISNGVNSIIAGTNVTVSPTGGQGDVTVTATDSTGTVSSIIAGTNITITPTGGTGAVTINAAAGGGLPETTTFYAYLSGGVGEVFIATNSFIPITSILATSSWTITGVKAYNTFTSSCASTAYSIAWSSMTGATCPWQYITTNIGVAANTQMSSTDDINGWTAVLSTCPATLPVNSTLSLHIAESQAIKGFTQSTFPSRYGMIIRAWIKN